VLECWIIVRHWHTSPARGHDPDSVGPYQQCLRADCAGMLSYGLVSVGWALFLFRDCPEKFEALKLVRMSGSDGIWQSIRPADIISGILCQRRLLQDIAQAKDYLQVAKKGYRQPAQ